MAFLDKLNTIAKNVGEKTGDAIEITKLNAKISGEKSAISELYKQLGEKIYEKYAAGAYQDIDMAELFDAVDARKANIADAEEKISAIKAENEARAQAGSAAQTAEKAAPAGPVCSCCGAPVAEGVKFCNQCGARQEAPAPIVVEAKKFCTNCGAEAVSGVKFCSQCGNKIE